MSNSLPSSIERLLVWPGSDCACCAGRFGFERGLQTLIGEEPHRTRKELRKLNPLYIRQLPSLRHQEVHVESMVGAMGSELPKLFKEWRKHLHTYPELPYLLHRFLISRGMSLPRETLKRCKKISPFKFNPTESNRSVGFALKKRWLQVESLQELLQSLMALASLPIENYPTAYAYVPQINATLSDQLRAVQALSNAVVEVETPGNEPSREEREQQQYARRYAPTIAKRALSNIAEAILPVLIRTIGAEPGRDRVADVGSILDDFFAAGGRYKGSEFNIAELLFDIDPELLLSLERNRNALNGPSLAFLLERVDDVRRTVDALRVTAAQAYEREREVRILRHAEEQERQREHQEREAERAAHAATIQAARTAESLPAMTERLATLAILERMAAIASQIGYAPASFPGAWAAEITETHATELDESTLSVLVERTRGVQGGEWKMLHTRLLQLTESQ